MMGIRKQAPEIVNWTKINGYDARHRVKVCLFGNLRASSKIQL